MTRLRRPFTALALAILLVGMQYGAQLHALEHIGEALRQTTDHSLTTQHDEVCPICALFASGANALSDSGQQSTAGSFDQIEPTCAPEFPARPPLHFYYSRAPPALL